MKFAMLSRSSSPRPAESGDRDARSCGEAGETALEGCEEDSVRALALFGMFVSEARRYSLGPRPFLCLNFSSQVDEFALLNGFASIGFPEVAAKKRAFSLISSSLTAMPDLLRLLTQLPRVFSRSGDPLLCFLFGESPLPSG